MGKIVKQDVVRLIELIGGNENIASVSHCLTRLRFVLNDTEKA
ncbi:PTS transporter subunit EIIB, partial [Bacillus cereus group sp. Bce027]